MRYGKNEQRVIGQPEIRVAAYPEKKTESTTGA